MSFLWVSLWGVFVVFVGFLVLFGESDGLKGFFFGGFWCFFGGFWVIFLRFLMLFGSWVFVGFFGFK